MKTKCVVFVIILQIICVFAYAQNHQHFTPYRSESVRIIRIDTNIYKETTAVVIEGLSSTTNVDVKVLYTIPKHLRKLDTETIDAVVRKNASFTTIRWSWFIIWEYTYTKIDICKKFSWVSIKNLFIGYCFLIILFLIVVFSLAKSIKKGIMQLKSFPSVEDYKFDIFLIFAYHLLIDIIAMIITVIQYPIIDLDVFFGFIVYNCVILVMLYLLNISYRKCFK